MTSAPCAALDTTTAFSNAMKRLVILQAQPWREHDWLIDCLTSTGRMRLVLNKPQTPPDLFQLYQADWPNKLLPAVKGWHVSTHWRLTDTALYCGLYLNELLGLLLPENEPAAQLFDHYCQTLEALAQQQLPDPWLRLFEGQLLQALGYGLVWHQDYLGRPIQLQQHYQFKPRQGFVVCAVNSHSISGQDLLAISQGSRSRQHWRMIRLFMRAALDDILPRPLVSRELLASHLLLQERK